MSDRDIEIVTLNAGETAADVIVRKMHDEVAAIVRATIREEDFGFMKLVSPLL